MGFCSSLIPRPTLIIVGFCTLALLATFYCKGSQYIDEKWKITLKMKLIMFTKPNLLDHKSSPNLVIAIKTFYVSVMHAPAL